LKFWKVVQMKRWWWWSKRERCESPWKGEKQECKCERNAISTWRL